MERLPNMAVGWGGRLSGGESFEEYLDPVALTNCRKNDFLNNRVKHHQFLCTEHHRITIVSTAQVRLGVGLGVGLTCLVGRYNLARLRSHEI